VAAKVTPAPVHYWARRAHGAPSGAGACVMYRPYPNQRQGLLHFRRGPDQALRGVRPVGAEDREMTAMAPGRCPCSLRPACPYNQQRSKPLTCRCGSGTSAPT
jgi:hypothetical protein